MGLKFLVDCRLTTKGEDLTHVVVRIGTEIGQEPAPEVSAKVWQDMRKAIENFKVLCEADGR
ncbi:hypothetical protein D1BOALGB6SA_1828 [Olavius sp. associated proteobacterium Delta 1]|nr:hypothetical protein D1BOALGB6SA_1828 [Olavius sp. associated proteobacterium Delta 1]